MNLVERLRPALPVPVAVVGALVTLAVASRVLPGRVVMVHLSETGGSAFAASRGDLVLLGAVLVVAVVVTWVVSAFFLAVTPARHVLVPHASFWTQTANRSEMRRRYARYLAVGTSASLWFVAGLFVLAMLSQSGPLAVWWLPAVLSVGFVLFVLIGLIWVFTAGFAPTTVSIPAGRPSSTSGASPPAPASMSTSRPTSRATAVRAPTGAQRTASVPPLPTGTPRREPGRPGGTSPGRPGGTTPGRPGGTTPDGPRKGPPRPYQPRPRSGGPRG